MLTLILATSAAAQELSGYAEARAQVVGGVEGQAWNTVEVFRPEFDVEPSERLRLHVGVQAEVVQGRDNVGEALALVEDQLNPALVEQITAAGCEFEAPARYERIDDVLSVERLYVDVYTRHVDLRVGRQALNWGSALFLNPTDLFAEVLVAEPWRQRAGVDAVRATVPIGERHQVVAAGAVSPELDEGRFGAKATVNVLQTDVSALGAVITDWEGAEGFVGFDVKGQVVVGWWAEGRTSLDEPALVVSTGVDYSFPVLDRLYLAAQYTWDGTGLEDPALYSLEARGTSAPLPDCARDQLAAEDVETTEARFTMGRHYGLLTANVAAWDRWSGSLTGVMNLQDASTMLIPTVAWTPGDAWSVNVGAQVPLGEGELAPGEALTTVDLGPTTLDLSGLVPSVTAFAYLRYSL